MPLDKPKKKSGEWLMLSMVCGKLVSGHSFWGYGAANSRLYPTLCDLQPKWGYRVLCPIREPLKTEELWREKDGL